MIRTYSRQTRVIVDAAALENNWSLLREALSPNTSILAIVKANGYGHGAFRIARLAGQLGAVGVGVADISEALSLREQGFGGDILCLGALTETGAHEAIELGLTVTIYSPEELDAILAMKTGGNRLRVHVKINSGMHRLGLDPESWEGVSSRLSENPHLRVEGIFTHLSESAEADPSFTREQLRRFTEAVAHFEKRLGRRLIRHAANSGAILRHPESHFDWVRPGIALYGFPPSTRDPRSQPFQPVLEWRAPILQVRSVASGEYVGYNRGFRTSKPMRIATLGVGYGDGYRRAYAPAGVGLRGIRCPILGIVCMDLMMVDVTQIPDVRPGEDVTLMESGRGGGPTAEELADLASTIPYEVLTAVSSRVSRELG